MIEETKDYAKYSLFDDEFGSITAYRYADDGRVSRPGFELKEDGFTYTKCDEEMIAAWERFTIKAVTTMHTQRLIGALAGATAATKKKGRK